MTLAVIHARVASAVVMFALIAGLWGIAARLRSLGVSANYWGVLAVGVILFIGQAALGALLWLTGARPTGGGIHLLYGALVAAALPFYYRLSKGRDDRTAALLYGLACLAVAALAVRAISTGG